MHMCKIFNKELLFDNFSPKDVYVGYLPLAHVLELGAGKKCHCF